ncbi:MAG: right-handed parallel beta-helix repeat-containing protein [Candidatus Thorarchaeota archaeon]
MSRKILVVLIILLISLGSLRLDNSIGSHPKLPDQNNVRVILTEPIIIRCNENFTDYGFSGEGTKEEPYIIENYTLQGYNETDECAIQIENTTKHFIIKNCHISNCYYGLKIKVENCSVILEDNIITEGYFGITSSVKNCAFKIENCQVAKCVTGMEINTTLSNNEKILVQKNWIGNCSFIGMKLIGKGIQATNNTIVNVVGWAVLLQMTDQYLAYNNISDNNVGIYGENIDNSIITKNNFKNNSHHGIYFDRFCDNNIIFHNNFIENYPEAISQARDSAYETKSNVWYNETLKEGNYWSDWNGISAYRISGEAEKWDHYPLNQTWPMKITPKTTNVILKGMIITLPMMILGVIIRKKREKKEGRGRKGKR